MALVAAAACSQVITVQTEARQSSATPASQIKACSLLPKEEVKKHLPWNAIVDSMPPEEEKIGTYGSSCNYPSVFIQVLPGSKTSGPPTKNDKYETITGVGQEAYFRNNRNRYAELYIRAGNYTLTLQANADGNVEAVKPRVVSLAQALLAKLR